MKWMIRVDMEGLTGVVNMDQVKPGAPYYDFGLRMLKHDLESVINGLLLKEDDEVWLYDIHFFGTNVDLLDLDPRVKAICGKPNYTPQNLGYLNNSFDGMILLGLHAMAEVPGAVLNHNYEHDIRQIWVRNVGNEYRVGEIGLEALIAGEAQVPLVMVTGDDKGNQEALELLPHLVTVTVKESLGDTAALCYPTSVTGKLLWEGARMCREQATQLHPFKVMGPVELDMTFRAGELLNKLQSRIPEAFKDSHRIILKGDSVLEAWEKYLIAKE